MLYIVATPIGNLEDITFRAVGILKSADMVLAEDTRRFSILAQRYEIRNRVTSFNDFNKEKKTAIAISVLKEGKDVALVSDAGTPGINDPAFYIVRECIKEGIGVSPVPGPCAAVSALVCSGLPTDRFMFYGFVPKRPGQKEKFFRMIGEREETSVIYESPHRIKDTLEVMARTIPEKDIVIAREITKKFEEFIRGKAIDVYNKVKERDLRGEMVLVLK